MAWALLLGAGLIGVASLALVPLETLVPRRRLSPAAIRALALVQPGLLTALAVWTGTRMAPAVGLTAPLATALADGGAVGAVLAAQAAPAALTGAMAAAVLVLYGRTTGARLKAVAGDRPLARLEIPLATRLLYGGITEELLCRWGLMTLLAWSGRALTGGATATVMSGAVMLSALLFAAGHLPMLKVAAVGASGRTVAAVIAGNTLPGIGFGWLFWRHGLEAAMIAHALAHLLAAPLLPRPSGLRTLADPLTG